MNIRPATEHDAAEIAGIYNWYIANTTITFETLAVSAEEVSARLREMLASYDWLVGEVDGRLVGYAYYGSFRTRAAYAHTVESTIYLSRDETGRGWGKPLYRALINSVRTRGFREMLGVIALPNPSSVALHEALGFKAAGLLRNVGNKFGQYIDVGIWQLSVS